MNNPLRTLYALLAENAQTSTAVVGTFIVIYLYTRSSR